MVKKRELSILEEKHAALITMQSDIKIKVHKYMIYIYHFRVDVLSGADAE